MSQLEKLSFTFNKYWLKLNRYCPAGKYTVQQLEKQFKAAIDSQRLLVGSTKISD